MSHSIFPSTTHPTTSQLQTNQHLQNPELLVEIATHTTPKTIRTLRIASKTLSKLLTPTLISHIDASWIYTRNGEKACWIWAAKNGHTHIIDRRLRDLVAGEYGGEGHKRKVKLTQPQLVHYSTAAHFFAAGRGHIDIATLLVKAGAQMTWASFESHMDPFNTFNSSTPAKRKEIFFEMVVVALPWNPDKDQDFVYAFVSDFAFRRAALKGSTGIVQFFIERKFVNSPANVLLYAEGMLPFAAEIGQAENRSNLTPSRRWGLGLIRCERVQVRMLYGVTMGT
ncbi:hypothetical protein HK097_010881 [Rhizophlyctis rosea]|uniref:Uncharacterized protein n=1 Tax=Rhizophlyctis rosea TaxID=64517 RepID=A0AAD5S8G1_9FUNG|nr:hypothetical protein HK097_010881 [Rhizophlyctis rosea]